MSLDIDHIYVPIKFDLGGTVQDVEPAIPLLAGLGTITVDVVEHEETRAYNISYLATHPPVLQLSLGTSAVRIGRTTWATSTQVVIYPALGVISVDLRFAAPEPAVSTEDICQFYDDLIRENTVDYFRHLRDLDTFPPNLARHLSKVEAENFEAGGLTVAAYVEAIRGILRDSAGFEPRERRYPFQNMRQFFVLRGPEQHENAPIVESLLRLSALPVTPGAAADDGPLRLRGLMVRTTGWSTVAVLHDGVDGGTAAVRLVQDMYGQIHAQWFFCQLWVGVDPNDRDELVGPGHSLGARITHLARVQLQLARGLAEVGNVDLMYRDPVRIAVATFLIDGLRVSRHLQAARQRLELLRSNLGQLFGLQTALFQQRLQWLFSVTAVAGVAALLPEMMQVESMPWRIVTAALFGTLAVFCWLLIRLLGRAGLKADRVGWAVARIPGRARRRPLGWVRRLRRRTG
ncbi:hypothetical protein [Micromonospora sp. NBC_01638]|uniref:hypothetical protein n=1 Tax=Micromonospora sp. NBC_01638 TaxID=2975982 RepID=UPI00386DA2A0|nr:hypothetical protein OG811_29260 [Micromonospora sp. NBC_01638]